MRGEFRDVAFEAASHGAGVTRWRRAAHTAHLLDTSGKLFAFERDDEMEALMQAGVAVAFGRIGKMYPIGFQCGMAAGALGRSEETVAVRAAASPLPLKLS